MAMNGPMKRAGRNWRRLDPDLRFESCFCRRSAIANRQFPPTIPPHMEPYIIALLIFGLRLIDVSIGTVRVIYTIRGNRLASFLLGVVESGVWIFAISKAFVHVDHPASMIGWAFGFGAGVALGITLEQ